jgi:hypothetical protein
MFVPGGNGNGNGGGGSAYDPFGGIPKELRPDEIHFRMAAAIMHRQGAFAPGGAYGPKLAMDVSRFRPSTNVEDMREEYLKQDPALSDVPMTEESYAQYREQQRLSQTGIDLGDPDLPKTRGKIKPEDLLR